ncbi:unnamed protein product [Allacma fusca]|uniref:Uncharacterized protein n=1 Tax=Allacma fusca TaxID=39272 RepID=A0A8J2JV92_9HEXA|nr:unnamed protein product [Allacma fusca]
MTFADSAWLAYDSLEQICTFGDGSSSSGNTHFNLASTNFTTRFSRMHYSRECNNETLPYSGYFAASGYSNERYENLKKCEHEFNRTLGNATYHKFSASIFMLCRSIDLDDVESLMRNKIEKKFSQELTAGESLANKHDFVQAMMIIQISEASQFCARNVCKLDASRNENARL